MDGGPRGNELVVWIDDEMRRDLFTELQMCHDPGPYANRAGVASDPKNRSRICLVSGSDPEFRRREATRLRSLPRDRSNSPSVLSPSSRSRADCARCAGLRNSSRKSFHGGPSSLLSGNVTWSTYDLVRAIAS